MGSRMVRRVATVTWVLLLSAFTLAQTFSLDKKIFDPKADARQAIADALQQASAGKKRVLLVFGANWCPDCHALDYRLNQPEIKPLVDRNFVVVPIDVGEVKPLNEDLARRYDVPRKRGIPAIAVLDSKGKLLFSQQHGEFSSARNLPPEKIIEFLKQWAVKK